jgi:hypothetical protein
MRGRHRRDASPSGGASRFLLGALVAAVLAVAAGIGWSTPLGAQSIPAGPMPATDYVFRSDLGLLVFHVRPDRATDFEGVIARITQGLEAATDPVRRQQQAGFRIFKAAESATNATVYVAVVDPVVTGADYDPVRMITELLPGESTALYERLRAAVIKIERVGLARLR